MLLLAVWRQRAEKWDSNAPTLEYCNGEWSGVIPNWKVRLGSATFILAPSEQGQLGIFPEQIVNWKWLPITLNQNKIQGEKLRVLNGFAYTGGSTMAALSVDDVEVVHLDASKSAVQWAMRNANASDMIHKPVKWIVDDCMTFVDREIKRKRTYHGIIFDPPAFGRGGGQRVWKLSKDLPLLAERFSKLLHPTEAKFALLSCHDPDWSGERLAQLLRESIPHAGSIEHGVMELRPAPRSGEGALGLTRALPLGTYARWTSAK